ncbi:MAG: maleate cis-trans isomerase family protein [Candidatus Binatia bacterium]
MVFASWRGVVGCVKPTHRPGSLEEFIRLLPEGIGVVPVYLNFQRGTEDEFRAALNAVHEKVAELAKEGVDLIHPEGAPPFMAHGFNGEAKIVKEWESEFKIPIVTAGQTQVEALRALGIKKFVGVTYFTGSINDMFTKYFHEAGFNVLAMEGMEVAFADVGRLASTEIYAHTRRAFLRNPGADGIYMLGTGWRCLDIIHLLEEDLQVPVVHAVPARVWSVQKRLHVRQAVKGFGRLLEEMP